MYTNQNKKTSWLSHGKKHMVTERKKIIVSPEGKERVRMTEKERGGRRVRGETEECQREVIVRGEREIWHREGINYFGNKEKIYKRKDI